MKISATLGIILAIECLSVAGRQSLKIDFQWSIMDYEFPSESVRNETIANGSFIRTNVIPYGFEVTPEKIFITTPRLYAGVWSSLNYISRNDNNPSPKLIPYPNTAMHTGNPAEIISPVSVRQDRCGRLWILDTGIYNFYENQSRYPPSLQIFNLSTNERILKYAFPLDLYMNNSIFTSLALEVVNCSDIYAYAADVKAPALVVYSFKSNSSWKISNSYFEPSHSAENFTGAGVSFKIQEGIYGLALTGVQTNGFSTLYFTPMAGFHTYKVSTRVLRDPAVNSSKNEFHDLGSRGIDTQIGPLVFHKKSDVLIYGMFNRNAIGCWNSKSAHNSSTQGIIHEDNSAMINPTDVILDGDILWVLSNKIMLFLKSKIDYGEYNYRILRSTVAEAVEGTICSLELKEQEGKSAGSHIASSPFTFGLTVILTIGYLYRNVV